MHKYKIKANISGEPMCYFLCCCKGEDEDDKDNEINLFKLDEKSLEQLEKTEIEYTGRVQNDFIWYIPLRNEMRNCSTDRGALKCSVGLDLLVCVSRLIDGVKIILNRKKKRLRRLHFIELFELI